MPRPVYAVSLALGLSGCGVFGISEENFPGKIAGPVCDQLRRCERGYFESEYSDMADCKEELEEDFEDLAEAADDANCDYNEDEAQACLDAVRSASCEDWYEGDAYDDCDEVFDDCGTSRRDTGW